MLFGIFSACFTSQQGFRHSVGVGDICQAWSCSFVLGLEGFGVGSEKLLKDAAVEVRAYVERIIPDKKRKMDKNREKPGDRQQRGSDKRYYHKLHHGRKGYNFSCNDMVNHNGEYWIWSFDQVSVDSSPDGVCLLGDFMYTLTILVSVSEFLGYSETYSEILSSVEYLRQSMESSRNWSFPGSNLGGKSRDTMLRQVYDAHQPRSSYS
ncbi:hypothetical protein V6N13_053034 [Hibiscus sabdariffa]|uniref:Uncharacterized protein n=1 Tax=Hibiscus sabdariffa TaxID=183260 RepID=A0ABR2Q631_9ROSI